MPRKSWSIDTALQYFPSNDVAPGRGTVKRHYLKYRSQNGISNERCDLEDCPLHTAPATWCGQLLPLELDHIDGASLNNRAKNLRLLCPNCHRQQEDTHGGANASRTHCHEGGIVRYRKDGLRDIKLMAETGTFEVFGQSTSKRRPKKRPRRGRQPV